MMNKDTQTTHFWSSALAAALTITLLLGASSAQAADVIHDPAGNATIITNLEVDGQFYDVEFLWGAGSDILDLPFTFSLESNALAAVDAVNLVLAAESTPVTTVSPTPNTSDAFVVPYDVSGNNAQIVRGNSDGSGGWTSESTGEWVEYAPPLPEPRAWARFSPAGTVPVQDKSWGLLKSIYR